MTFTMPFYISVVYSLGALWALRRVRSSGLVKEGKTVGPDFFAKPETWVPEPGPALLESLATTITGRPT
jgi:hypothetical protein